MFIEAKDDNQVWAPCRHLFQTGKINNLDRAHFAPLFLNANSFLRGVLPNPSRRPSRHHRKNRWRLALGQG